MTRPYVYRVREVHRVIDGDTFHLTVGLGLYLRATIPVRLLGADCPEINRGSELERRVAREAREFVVGWFTPPGDYWVRTEADPDSFGRWLGEVWQEVGPTAKVNRLADALTAAGLAVPWPSRWYETHDPERNLP